MSPKASHRVRPGLSSAASLMTTLLISFDQEVLNQHLNLVTPEYPFFESPWGEGGLYVTRFAVAIPPDRASTCLATVANTAGALGLASHAEERALSATQRPCSQRLISREQAIPLASGQSGGSCSLASGCDLDGSRLGLCGSRDGEPQHSVR